MTISEERFNEIAYGLASFMRSLERLKDFRNYYRKALDMGLAVEELDAFVARYERERVAATADTAARQAWRAQFEEKMERCPQHPERPALLRIVPDPDGGGIVLACPACRWSRYEAATTPQAYLAGLGIAPPQRSQDNGKA